MKPTRTYGEAKIYAINNSIIDNGIATLHIPSHKPKMTPDEAAEYYNKKLFKYWITQISDEIPARKREDVLSYLLGIRQ